MAEGVDYLNPVMSVLRRQGRYRPAERLSCVSSQFGHSGKCGEHEEANKDRGLDESGPAGVGTDLRDTHITV